MEEYIPGHVSLDGEQENVSPNFDLLCLSHLRWDFVYQRPQHLLSRCAEQHRVFFFEEPVFVDSPMSLDVSQRTDRLFVVTPLLPMRFSLLRQPVDRLHMQPVNEALREEIDKLQRELLAEMMTRYAIEAYVLWYYTPMALPFSDHLRPLATVYDCMDELSAFKYAPVALLQHEEALFKRADVVFTGGQSLYEAKRHRHTQIYAFPSSVDAAHFRKAFGIQHDPADQVEIPHPRLGFYGVIDERLDLHLLEAIADAQPNWHLVLIGPVVKIDPSDLPRRANIHYLGPRPYSELPTYLAGWDTALLPFACNEATRFISPTKTLEYLAGGKAVVSTPILDVIRPYGEQGLVHIGHTPDEFIACIRAALNEDTSARLCAVDTLLAQIGWDSTWRAMRELIEGAVYSHQLEDVREESIYV